jgi:hypothetical protein
MQIGVTRGIGPARISSDNFKLRIIFACFLDAAVQDRMRKSRRTGDKNHFSVIDIFVTARRRVGTQRLLVPCNGTRHTQAGIAVDIIRTDLPLASLLKT